MRVCLISLREGQKASFYSIDIYIYIYILQSTYCFLSALFSLSQGQVHAVVLDMICTEKGCGCTSNSVIYIYIYIYIYPPSPLEAHGCVDVFVHSSYPCYLVILLSSAICCSSGLSVLLVSCSVFSVLCSKGHGGARIAGTKSTCSLSL